MKFVQIKELEEEEEEEEGEEESGRRERERETDGYERGKQDDVINRLGKCTKCNKGGYTTPSNIHIYIYSRRRCRCCCCCANRDQNTSE